MPRRRFGALAVVAVALSAAVLIGPEPRQPLAVARPGTPPGLSGSPGAAPVDYGSGKLGAWQDLGRRISSTDQLRDVLRSNGVVMFGDSVTMQDCAAFERLLTSTTGDALAVHNWSGRPTSAAVDALADWERRFGIPSRIVMALGTNDIFDPPAFAAQIERAMRIAGPNRTVYWVNVHVGRVKQPADVRTADLENSAWVNRQLDDAARRHPNLRIVRWAEFLAADPARVSTYLRDGVHTAVPLGQKARNELIVGALQGR